MKHATELALPDFVIVPKIGKFSEGLSWSVRGHNMTIKNGDIAPWKDLNKNKRKEQRNNYILIWG